MPTRTPTLVPTPTLTPTETSTPVPTIIGVDITKFRGGHISDVVVSPDGKRTYAVAQGTDNVFVIDTMKHTVEDVIYLPSDSAAGAMPYRAAITPDGKTLYTANMGDDTVSVIDLDQNEVVTTIGVRDIPWGVDVSRDGAWAYVVVANWELWELAKPGLVVIDTASQTVKKTIDFPDRNLAFTVTSTHDGSRVLVVTSCPQPDGWHACLHVIDARTLEILTQIELGFIEGNWGKLAVTEDDTTLYVSGGQKVGRISIIDLPSTAVKEEREIPVEATEIALSPDETKLNVLSPGSHQLFSLDLGSNELVTVLDFNTVFTGTNSWVSGDMRGLAIAPDGYHVYLGAFESEAVVVADTLANNLVALVKLNDYASELWDMVMSSDGNFLYVGENARDPRIGHGIIVVDAKRNVVVDRIGLETGGGSIGLAIAEDDRFLYVAQMTGRVAELDLTTRQITREFTVVAAGSSGGMVSDVAPVSGRGKLYATVAGSNEGSVAIVDLVTGSVIQRIAFDWLPQMLAVSPDGSKVYVSRFGAQWLLGERFNPADVEWFTRAAVAVIETDTDQLLTTVAPEGSYAPAGRLDLLETDRDGTHVYFYSSRDMVTVMETETNQVVRNIDLRTGRHGPVGVHPTDVAFLSDGSRAYIPCGDSYLMAVVDTQTGDPIGWVKLGLEPVAVVISPDDRFAYITNRRSEEISVVDLATNTVTTRVSVRR